MWKSGKWIVVAILLPVFSGCRSRKASRPAAQEQKVRCQEFADEAAAALQESGSAADDKSVAAWHERLLAACRKGELERKAVDCFLKPGGRDMAALRGCLPEDYLPEEDQQEELRLGPLPEGVKIPPGVKVPKGVVFERRSEEEEDEEE